MMCSCSMVQMQAARHLQPPHRLLPCPSAHGEPQGGAVVACPGSALTQQAAVLRCLSPRVERCDQRPSCCLQLPLVWPCEGCLVQLLHLLLQSQWLRQEFRLLQQCPPPDCQSPEAQPETPGSDLRAQSTQDLPLQAPLAPWLRGWQGRCSIAAVVLLLPVRSSLALWAPESHGPEKRCLAGLGQPGRRMWLSGALDRPCRCGAGTPRLTWAGAAAAGRHARAAASAGA